MPRSLLFAPNFIAQKVKDLNRVNVVSDKHRISWLCASNLQKMGRELVIQPFSPLSRLLAKISPKFERSCVKVYLMPICLIIYLNIYIPL